MTRKERFMTALAGRAAEIKAACQAPNDNLAICGEGGGYIMDTVALLDDAKPENIRAWFEFTREYGTY